MGIILRVAIVALLVFVVVSQRGGGGSRSRSSFSSSRSSGSSSKGWGRSGRGWRSRSSSCKRTCDAQSLLPNELEECYEKCPKSYFFESMLLLVTAVGGLFVYDARHDIMEAISQKWNNLKGRLTGRQDVAEHVDEE